MTSLSSFKRAGFALIVTMALTAAQAQDKVSLHRIVKAKEKYVYALKVLLSVQGTEVNISGKSTEEILQLEKGGGWVAESMDSDMVVEVGGQKMDSPEHADKTKSTYDGEGFIIKHEGGDDDPGMMLAGVLTGFIYPKEQVGVGSKWTYSSKPAKGLTIPETVHNFEILGKEKMNGMDVFKVKGTAKIKKGDTTMDGTFWVDLKSGNVQKFDGKLKSIEMGGQAVDAAVTLTITK